MSAQMHFELGFASEAFFDVIHCAQSLHIISSRMSFADLIQRLVPSKDVEFIPIPGERPRVTEVGDTSVLPEASNHYPVRYKQVIDNIDLSAKPGSLWLIGAGLLAKLYCMRVRNNGGVAVDLGSMVDLYAGVNSHGFPLQLVQRVEAQVASLRSNMRCLTQLFDQFVDNSFDKLYHICIDDCVIRSNVELLAFQEG